MYVHKVVPASKNSSKNTYMGHISKVPRILNLIITPDGDKW
jgi:hypothetical protein